jgi:hypothetical protein
VIFDRGLKASPFEELSFSVSRGKSEICEILVLGEISPEVNLASEVELPLSHAKHGFSLRFLFLALICEQGKGREPKEYKEKREGYPFCQGKNHEQSLRYLRPLSIDHLINFNKNNWNFFIENLAPSGYDLLLKGAGKWSNSSTQNQWS